MQIGVFTCLVTKLAIYLQRMKMLDYYTGPLFIDFDFGLDLLLKYFNDLNLVETGGCKFSDLGYSEARKAQKPTNLSINLDGFSSQMSIAGTKRDYNIRVINITGAMRLEDGMSSYGMRTVGDWLMQADADEEVDGIKLNITSGGGESTAGEYLVSVIEELSKPIVAHGIIMGSAAYWTAAATDEIILNGPMSSAGSIGAYFSYNKEVIQFLKENFEFIYSDSSPDKNKVIRELMEGEKGEAQRQTNEIADIFRQRVTELRDLTNRSANLEKVLSGGMFRGVEAKKMGLVDGIGGNKYAIKRLLYHINF